MKAKDIMTKNVSYLNPNATITEAAQLMQKQNIGAVPVCDQNGVVGIVTDRDIVVRNVAHGTNPQSTIVRDVMTSQITTTSPDTDLADVSTLMSQNQIRRIPVVENNMVVGMVSLGDIATGGKYNTEVADTLINISTPSKPIR